MVTAIRWMQKFVGRAESTLPSSTSAYLHLTTDFFSVQMEDFYQKTSVLETQRRLKERAGPVPCLVPEQTASVDGGLSVCQALCSHRPRLFC